MKWLFGVILFMAIASTASAQLAPTYVDPVYPGSTLRDYSRPSYVIQGGTITPTIPGTYLPDTRRGGYVIQPGMNSGSSWDAFNTQERKSNTWATDDLDD
jgi:hypothetical protein